jgi:hypothetical protein
MTQTNATTTNSANASASATDKSKGAKKLVKSKSKSKSKGAKKLIGRHTDVGARVAVNTKTGAALKFTKLGAFGGRGARTSAIENVIVGAGAKGATIREIEAKTSAAAVAMHVRTLFTGARPSIGAVLGRKRDEKTGAWRYFAKTRKSSNGAKKTSAAS